MAYGLKLYKKNGSLRLDLSGGTVGRILYSGVMSSSGSVNCGLYQGVNSSAQYFASGALFPLAGTTYQATGGNAVWWTGVGSHVANWTINYGPCLVLIIGWK